jgi:endonuclease YncB( thermonuclease family)
MLCIAGVYTVIGAEPDGDSVRFVPDDPAQFARIPGPNRVRTNAHGGAQLRLDGIDALETHYGPAGGHPLHQPLALAEAAAAELLDWLGFRGVVRDGQRVTAAQPDAVTGYVLTRTADANGRCVALAGRDGPPAAGGTWVHVTVEMLGQTANQRLMAAGLAYPTFYSKLFPDLRAELAAQAAEAARAGAGLWPQDRTQTGVEVVSLRTLTDEAVILPKLFRRLVDYLHIGGGHPSLAGFRDYLAQRDDRLLIIPTAHRTGFDFVVAVDGQTVSLDVAPENLVFDER